MVEISRYSEYHTKASISYRGYFCVSELSDSTAAAAGVVGNAAVSLNSCRFDEATDTLCSDGGRPRPHMP